MAGKGEPSTKRELERAFDRCQHELATCRKQQLGHAMAVLFDTTIRWGVLLVLGYELFKVAPGMVADISGENTQFHLDISVALSWVLSIGAVAMWARERRHKQREIERLGNELEDCRNTVDPNRGSSHLTTKGQTRKGDQP